MKHTQHAAYFYIKIMYNFESYNDGTQKTRCFQLEMGYGKLVGWLHKFFGRNIVK